MKSLKPSAVGMVVLLLGLCVAGCRTDSSLLRGKPCTEMGGWDGLALTLRAAGTRFPAGRYDVRLTRGSGSAESCYFTISDDPRECASGHCVKERACDAAFFIGHEGGDRVVFMFAGVETTVVFEVELDGTAVASEIIRPVYGTVYPNGPDCPPECLFAEYEMVLREGRRSGQRPLPD